jgi:hypothetical protein
MDGLRRSGRISKLYRDTNVYVRGYIDALDTIFDYITRKKLIWSGYVERMNLKLENNEVVPEEPGKMGYIQD